MTTQQLWNAVLGELELLVSKPNFNTWLKATFIVSHENNKVIVAVPNTFARSWLERKYHTMIVKALRNVSVEPVKEVIYKVETTRKAPAATMPVMNAPLFPEQTPSVPMPPKNDQYQYTFNPKYTFDNFVVGKYCELANAACLAVASNPGGVYNPLYIYGNVGLGKTHMLQAVGHAISQNFPEKKILFVTCEKFTNDYIQAVRSGRGKELKDIYRTVDVLIIDDIQFLSSKEGTQEEFFHTFNTLHQTNRQLVIASDRPPKAIPAIESRLLSRLEWGMIADITTPDLETRIAILKQKCQEKQIDLTYEVLNYIATMVHTNIRELEGALNRVLAYSQLQQGPLDLDAIKQILSTVTINPAKKSLTPRQLLDVVTEFYDIAMDDILGTCRKKELTVPRQIVMYLMREELKCSFPTIGAELGGRDHTTAIHAYNKITKQVDESPKIKEDLDLIRQRIYNI